MLNKLRRKFIAIAMLSVSIVLIAIVGTINIANYITTNQALDAREQQVIRLRYGLDGKAPMAQREVAALLGISRSYVSRIEKKAVGILRGCFADEIPHGL